MQFSFARACSVCGNCVYERFTSKILVEKSKIFGMLNIPIEVESHIDESTLAVCIEDTSESNGSVKALLEIKGPVIKSALDVQKPLCGQADEKVRHDFRRKSIKPSVSQSVHFKSFVTPSLGTLNTQRASIGSTGAHSNYISKSSNLHTHHRHPAGIPRIIDFFEYLYEVLINYADLLLPRHWTPYNPCVRAWHWFSIVCVMLTMIVTPFMGAFVSANFGLWVIAIFCDICFILDIVLHFGLPYERSGILVNSKKAIAGTYLLGRRGDYSGIVDILTTLPLELMCFLPIWTDVNVAHIAAELRYSKLLRFYRIPIFFVSVDITDINQTEVSLPIPQTAKDAEIGNDKFVGKIVNPNEPIHAYTVAIYWAVATTTSTGYGDVASVTIAEVWMASFFMLSGTLLFFGMMVGGLTSIMTNLDKQRATFMHRLNNVKHVMAEMNISDDLRMLVFGYYEYMWLRNKGVKYESLFDTLPLSFRQEISLQLNHKILDKAAIFSNVGPGFLRMISMYMRHRFFLPGQIISNAGEVGLQMYYIHRGMVEILGEDEDTPVATLKEGRIFGEISLVVNVPRSATIRAGCHCDLVVLEKHDLICVLKYFPEVLDRIRDIADHRYNRVDKALKNIERQTTSSVIAVSHEIPPRVYEVLANNIRHAIFDLHYNASKKCQPLIHRQHTVYSDDNMELFVGEDKSFPRGVPDTIWQELRQHFTKKFDFLFNTLVNPESTLFKVWETMILFVSVYIGTYVVYLGSFMTNGSVSTNIFDGGIGTSLQAICSFVDVLNFLDIIFQLRTAVYTPNGLLEDFASIKRYYVHSPRFVLDVLAVVPFDFFAAGDHRNWWFAVLKLNRALKLYKAPIYFKTKEDSILHSIVTIRIFKFAIYVPLCTHFIACAWFFQACGLRDRCAEDSWASKWEFAFDKNTSLTFMYVSSFYWATTTMSSTGYGDIVAYNNVGRYVAIIAMVTGLGLWGYLQAAMASTLSALDAPRVEFQSKVEMVKKFMKERNLDRDLREKAIKYLSLLWRCYRHEQHFGTERNMFSEVPLTLQQDMLLCEYGPFLNFVPLFRETDETLLRELSLKIQLFIYLPGTFIVTSDEVGAELYIIKRGHCEMLVSNRHSDVLFDLGPGNYFGETCVIFGGIHTHSVRAKTHVEVLMLTRSDVYEILQKFPTIQRQFQTAQKNKHFLYQMIRDASVNLVTRNFAPVINKAEKPTKLKKGLRKREFTSTTSRHRATYQQDESFGLKDLSRSSFRWFKRRNSNGSINEDYDGPFYALNPFSRTLSYLLLPVAILPSGTALKVMEFAKVFIALLIVVLTSLWFTFEPFFQTRLMQSVMLVICVVNLVFMYLSFHTGFYAQSVLVTHPIATARHYIHSNFFLDLLGTFPFHVIAYNVYLSRGDSTNVAVMESSFYSLSHLILFYRVPLIFSYYESLTEKHTGLIRLVKFVLYMTLFTHFLTCLMNMFACPPALFIDKDRESIILPPIGNICYKDTWVFTLLKSLRKDFVESHTCKGDCSYRIMERLLHGKDKPTVDTTEFGEWSFYYVNALYWASATTLSVGYGDIHPKSLTEMAVCTISMMVGVVFYAYIIAAVAASMANADARRAAFQEKLNNIRSYMKDFFTEDVIQNRVINHYEHVWQRTGGLEPNEMLKGLPYSLWADVTFNLYKHIINKMTLFQHAEKGFKKMLSRSILPMSYLKGEFIVKKGDPGQIMFFIHHGVVEITDEDGDKIIATLNPGRFFGEVSLLFEIPRTASIRAKTTVDVFCLTRDHLFEVMSHYTDFKKQIFAIATVKRLKAMEGLKTPVNKMNQLELEKHVYSCVWKNAPLNSLFAGAKDTDAATVSQEGSELSNIPVDNDGGLSRVVMNMITKVQIEQTAGKDTEAPSCPMPVRLKKKMDGGDDNKTNNASDYQSGNGGDQLGQTGHDTRSGTRQGFNQTARMVEHRNAQKRGGFCGVCGICKSECSMNGITNDAVANESVFPKTNPQSKASNSEFSEVNSNVCSGGDSNVGHVGEPSWGSMKREGNDLFKARQIISQMNLDEKRSRDKVNEKEFDDKMHRDIYGYDPHVPLLVGEDMDIHENLMPLSELELRVCDILKSLMAKREDMYLEKETNFAEHLDAFRQVFAEESGSTMSNSDDSTLWSTDDDSESDQRIHSVVSSKAGDTNDENSHLQECNKGTCKKSSTVKKNVDDTCKASQHLNTGIASPFPPGERNRGVLYTHTQRSQAGDVNMYQAGDSTWNTDKTKQDILFSQTEILSPTNDSITHDGHRGCKLRSRDFTRNEDVESRGLHMLEENEVNVGVQTPCRNQHERMTSPPKRNVTFSSLTDGNSAARKCEERQEMMLPDADYFEEGKASYQRNENARGTRSRSRVGSIFPTIPDSARDRMQRMSVDHVRRQRETFERAHRREESNLSTWEPIGPSTSSFSATGGSRRFSSIDDESLKKILKAEFEPNLSAKDSDVSFGGHNRAASDSCHLKRIALFLSNLNKFVIFPQHNNRYKRFRFAVILIGFVISILQIYLTTFEMYNPTSNLVFYAACLFFFVEIYIKFHVSFQDSTGLSCDNFHAVYRKYLLSCNGFWLDLVKEFPLEFLAILSSDSETSRYMYMYLKLNRTLRIIRCVQYVHEWESELNINVLLVRLYKYSIIFLTAVHSLACGWCMIACMHNKCQYGSWAIERGIDKMGYFDRYGNAVYWAIATMTSTGYGDISAYRPNEKGYAAFVMFVGKLMFGFILATISATLANAEVKHIFYEEKLTAIRTHLNDQKVAPELQRHVITYFAHLWKRNSGTDIKKLLHDAPYPLQSEFFLHLTEDFLRKIPILEKVSKAFMRHMSLCVRHMMLIEGDFLVRKGDVNSNLFYIHRGKCIVVSEDDQCQATQELHEGDFFGQANLVYSIPCCASIRCATHVDIFALNKESIEEAKSLFPDCAVDIDKLEREHYKEYEKFKVTPSQTTMGTDNDHLDVPMKTT